MAAYYKLFLLSLYALLATSFASNGTKEYYYESFGNETYPHGERHQELDTHPPTATSSNTPHSSQPKESAEQNSSVKNNSTPNSKNVEETIIKKNNEGGNIMSEDVSSIEKTSEQTIASSENDEVELAVQIRALSPGNELNNNRIVRQAENNSTGKLPSNDTNSFSTNNPEDVKQETPVYVQPTTNPTLISSLTTNPTLTTSLLTTNGSTSATKTVKRFWNSIKFSHLIAAVGVVGVLGWAYYILQSVH